MAKLASLFVIQNNATKELMPYGGSHAEFSSTKAPRVFARHIDALNCLKCWQMGHWYNDMDEYGDGAGPIPSDRPYNKPIAEARQAMDISIIPVALVTVPA